jgi:hypothetical protein
VRISLVKQVTPVFLGYWYVETYDGLGKYIGRGHKECIQEFGAKTRDGRTTLRWISVKYVVRWLMMVSSCGFWY